MAADSPGPVPERRRVPYKEMWALSKAQINER
jgi:hypothetical protein